MADERILTFIANGIRNTALTDPEVSASEALDLTEYANSLTSLDIKLHSNTPQTFAGERYYKILNIKKPDPLPKLFPKS